MPRNTINISIDSNNAPKHSTDSPDGSSDEEPKERRSKRQKVLRKKKMPAEKKGAILESSQSVGTKTKHHAQNLYFGNQYHKLDNVQKDSISNGFNSILDLANSTHEKNSQRSLFKDDWLKLNNRWNKQKNWDKLNDEVQKMLKTIENLPAGDLKKAYFKTL